MRTFASLDGYLATATDGGLQIHQYATADLGPVSVETGYPHDGRVVVTVTEDGPLALGLRIPVWSDTTTVQGPDGTAHPEPGTLHVVDRHWTAGDTVELVFDTTPHRYVADPASTPPAVRSPSSVAPSCTPWSRRTSRASRSTT